MYHANTLNPTPRNMIEHHRQRAEQPFRQQTQEAAVRHSRKNMKLIKPIQPFYIEKEENQSFAVGHLSLGYLLGKASSKLLKTNLSLSIIFTLSVLPDIDILFPFLRHRGPTHSLIVALLVFIPVFVVYGKKAAPYLLALISHPLIGDYIGGGGIQLLWPLTKETYGIKLAIRDPTSIVTECTLFVIFLILIIKTGDVKALLRPQKSNLILAVPTFTVILPTFLAFPMNVPYVLVLPHIVFLVLFSASMLTYIWKILRGK